MLAEFKEAMFNEFEMTNNELMSYFFGIKVKQQQDGIFISQKKYMKEILEKFKMSNYNLFSIENLIFMEKFTKEIEERNYK